MADDTDVPTLRRLLHACRRIAVVGVSAEWHRPSFFVAKYLLEHGRLFGGLNWAGVNTRVISSKRPRQLAY